MIKVKDSRNLAIIPARGGSKRVDRKNIRKIGGKPLISHTIEAAINSGVFDRIIFSSDDDEINELAENYNELTLVKREDKFSKDTSTVLELVNYIVCDNEVSKSYDVVSLLLPTCPFRRSSHIMEGIELLTNNTDSVVSVTDYDFPPQLGIIDEGEYLKPLFDPSPLITGNTRSQDQARIYRPNGGFYMSWMKSFVINKNFFRGRVKRYYMERLDSIDIDTESDLEYANFIYAKRDD